MVVDDVTYCLLTGLQSSRIQRWKPFLIAQLTSFSWQYLLLIYPLAVDLSFLLVRFDRTSCTKFLKRNWWMKHEVFISIYHSGVKVYQKCPKNKTFFREQSLFSSSIRSGLQNLGKKLSSPVCSFLRGGEQVVDTQTNQRAIRTEFRCNMR